MNYFKVILLLLLGWFLIDQFFLWMEIKGWIYYRLNKPSGSGVGNALEEFNALLNPSVRRVIEVKEQEARPRDDQGDDKDLMRKIKNL